MSPNPNPIASAPQNSACSPERTEHTQTVRDTVRHDEVEVEHADARRPARLCGFAARA